MFEQSNARKTNLNNKTSKLSSLILKEPTSFVRLIDFGDSSLKFEMVFWSKEVFIIENIKSDLRKLVYKKLLENNIEIPFPQRDINIKGLKKIAVEE